MTLVNWTYHGISDISCHASGTLNSVNLDKLLPNLHLIVAPYMVSIVEDLK